MLIKPGTKYKLNDAEMAVVEALVKLRLKRTEELGDASKATPFNGTLEEIDRDFFGSEIAAARIFNYFPLCFAVLGVALNYDGENNGSRVDVKVKKEIGHRLLASIDAKKKKEVDLFISMCGSFPDYQYRGYSLYEDLIQECNLVDLGHGKLAYGLWESQIEKDLESQSPIIPLKLVI